MSLNRSGIYAIINNINGNLYVGSATNVRKRWQAHRKDLRSNKHHSIYLQRAYNKYGIENFKYVVLTFCDKEDTLKKEQYFIDFFGMENLYNICPTAGSNLGRKFDKTHGQKISLAKKGKKTQPCPEYVKIKIGLAHKGKKLSEEHKQKLALAKLGKKRGPHSEEHKEKIRQSNLGTKRVFVNGQPGFFKRGHDLHAKPFCFKSPEGQIFTGINMKKFAEEHNLNPRQLSCVKRGKFKHHKGWTWVNEDQHGLSRLPTTL